MAVNTNLNSHNLYENSNKIIDYFSLLLYTLIFDSLEKEKSPNPFIHQGLRDFLIVQKVRNFLFFCLFKNFFVFFVRNYFKVRSKAKNFV